MIKEALHAFATTNERAWSHDRSQTVGASEVGQCARKVYWLKNENDPVHGAPRDPGYVETWGARVRGSVYEDQFWYPALKAHFGDALRFAGPNQRTFVSGFLSATPDGLLTSVPGGPAPGGLLATAPEGIVIECKSIDPRTKLDGPNPDISQY
jgi:hypothetical protein